MNWRPLRNPAFLVALAVLVAASAGLSAALSYFKIVLQKEEIYPAGGRLLSAIPRETPTWRAEGADRREAPDVEEVLGTTNYVTRTYVRKGATGRPMALDLHAAYYTGMVDTVPHVPDRCFVGGGMQIGAVVGDLPLPLDASRWRPDETVTGPLAGTVHRARLDNTWSDAPGASVRLPRDPEQIGLRTMQFLTKEGRPFYAGYFFIANGGTVSRAEEVRLLAFDRTSRYAFYCKVQVTSGSVSSGEELAREAASLFDELLPEIMRCVPDWVDVDRGDYPPDNPDRGGAVAARPAPANDAGPAAAAPPTAGPAR